MKEKEMKKIVDGLLSHDNKRSMEQLKNHGFASTEGFEAYEVNGECAGGRVSDHKEGDTCLVRVGDPVVFEGIYLGEVNKKAIVDGDERNLDIKLFEQDGDYAVVCEDVNDYNEVIFTEIEPVNFADIDIEVYGKLV